MSILDEYPPLQLGFRTTQLVVLFLFAGVLLFLAVVSILVATGSLEKVDPPVMTWALLGAAVLTLPAVAFARTRILDQTRKAARAGETAGGQITGLDEAGAAGRLLQGWRTATILMAAGLEGSALMCAVGALVEGNIAGILAGGVLALLLLFFLPTTARFEHWLEAELAALG